MSTGHSVGVRGLMSPGGVRGQGGDGCNVARVSHESLPQLSELCEVYFGIFVDMRQQCFGICLFPQQAVCFSLLSLFRGGCFVWPTWYSVVEGGSQVPKRLKWRDLCSN